MKRVWILMSVLSLLSGPSLFAEVKEIAGRDGAKLVYEEVGSDEPALVFIHCWSCNREYWRGQVKDLSQDFRLVLIDLPGHGESKPGEKIPDTVEKMAQQVVAVLDHLDLKESILVGSSMGGPIALEVARQRPKRVRGVIGVDTLQNAEFKFPKEMMEEAAAKMEADYARALREMMPRMFTPKSNPKIVEWAIAESQKSDPKVTIPLLRNFEKTDLKKLFKGAKVPIRSVNALPYSPEAQKTDVAVNRKYADFDVIEMAGVGHFLMLEKPKEFNAQLRRAIQAVLTASAE